MPAYDYECEACQQIFEVRQRITEPPLERCIHCGGRVHRVLAPTSFILKGRGFYVNDYPSESRKKAMEAEKTSSSDSSKSSSDTKPSTDASSQSSTSASTSSKTTESKTGES